MTDPFIERDGIRYVASMYVGDVRMVHRTWRERLFTRPWKPRQAYRSEPCIKFYRLHDLMYLVSYRTFARLESEPEFCPLSTHKD